MIRLRVGIRSLSCRALGQPKATVAICVFCCAMLLLAGFWAHAANPTSGTIAPSSQPVVWDGTAVGGSSPNGEGNTCVEGVSCDTFTLTVSGTPADWAGKGIQVKFTWIIPANDYDMYIHKTDNSGPVVHSSTGSAPETSETAVIVPSVDGTGVYTVHAVYFTVSPGDQYHATATVIPVPPAPPLPPLSKNWTIDYHGTCCEGNLAAQGSSVYVLLPVLLTGNKILRSDDDGKTWTQKYPPVNVSQPFGIEGDLNAMGNDIVFFGTEVTDGVCARSSDRGENWTVVPIPVAFVANDQAWAYLGPFSNLSPTQTAPYVLAGWYRIGSVALFSFDGGLTWPIQTPLVGDDGSGPDHIVCQQMAHDPTSPGDARIPDANFTKHKAGRHGAWGTDRKFYWTETASGSLYVCKTDNFGATWTGIKHPIVQGPAGNYVVTHTGFDNKGTLYVLHGNMLYVSFNQGESFAFVHTLPRWGNALRSDSGADQFFVADCGTIHIALMEAGAGGNGNVFYLRGANVDTAQPTWEEELVDVVGFDRLDFMQIVLDGNGIPTISYTTPTKEVTTASRATGTSSCLLPVSAVSRKTHRSAGVFDINLPLIGGPGIECRSGGANGDFQVVVTFPRPITFSSATVSSGTGTVAAALSSGNQAFVNLTGVANAQKLTLTLIGVNDGANTGVVSIPMGVLLGDVNASGDVDSADVFLVRQQTLHNVTNSNFRDDLNVSGDIDSADVFIARKQTLTSLP